ncbi:MAG TPA: type II secretion system F family protein [Gaiellaceae bacterium]|nr:type II secretion system F family protein [Gaiellaceae bacterium]
MRRLARVLLAACTATACAAAGASAQAGALKLKPLPSSGFPDRTYLLELPTSRALTAKELTVTENGNPVVSLAVQAPGGSANAVLLLIDASESMKGAPIAGAMAAARAFLAERKRDLRVAVLAFSSGQTVLTDFTDDGERLAAAVASAPALAYGTEIYDSLVRAAEMAKDAELERATVVLLSDGSDVGSEATRAEAQQALAEANVRVISIGLASRQFDPEALRSIAQRTGGSYVEARSVAALRPIFAEIGQQLSREYEITYRSLMPPSRETVVEARVPGFRPARAVYTTPALDLAPRGTFERSWVDQVITSAWLMVFVVVSVLALVLFAILTIVDVRRRSLRRRMAQYVNVPSEEESRLRRAEVAALLAEKAQKRFGGTRWWQRFETDVDLAGFRMSPLAIAGWTIVGGIAASLVAALLFQSLAGLLVGLAAPFVTRFLVSRKVARVRTQFGEQLPDNLDVLAGALRTGHSMMGALAVMVESASEPSKSEFRRVLQDEQLGVPLDDALMVMARRMQSADAEQVALVMRLQREAGGNTAEVLDRVAETIRGRMELRRLVRVLTAQARISRWILTALPVVVFVLLLTSGEDYLDPMLGSTFGIVALAVGGIMVLIGSWWIKKIAELDV